MPRLLIDLKNKWFEFAGKMNKFGIPLPLVRDPKTGRGDVALTLVFLSSIWVQIGLVGKWAHWFQSIDMGQALNWFYACSALYWARKLSSDGKGKTDLGDSVQPQSLPANQSGPKDPQEP